jgi:Fe-S cluster assembly ATP-binding protein
MSEPLLVIEDLHASVEGKTILGGVDLVISRGEVHALMGPNGSGKSTLANLLLGHPGYEISRGRITFKGEDVTRLPPDERAKRGLFLAFQYPIEVPGGSGLNFLRSPLGAVRGEKLPVRQFRQLVEGELKALGMDLSFARRNLNEGFSGGEKKRNEILQMALLRPELSILDETDSGLDIDAIRIVAKAVSALRGPERSFLVITHYMRIFQYLTPDRVHILLQGKVVKSGGPDLAKELEETGYEPLRSDAPAGASHEAPASFDAGSGPG